MTAYRVHYYICNYDYWHHYKDFESLDEANQYSQYLLTVSDIRDVSIVKVTTDKLYSR